MYLLTSWKQIYDLNSWYHVKTRSPLPSWLWVTSPPLITLCLDGYLVWHTHVCYIYTKLAFSLQESRVVDSSTALIFTTKRKNTRSMTGLCCYIYTNLLDHGLLHLVSQTIVHHVFEAVVCKIKDNTNTTTHNNMTIYMAGMGVFSCLWYSIWASEAALVLTHPCYLHRQ